MKMYISNAEGLPCTGCVPPKRWVSDSGRCHGTCQEYIEWKVKHDALGRLMRKEKGSSYL